jgi:hypothetical protein
LSTILRFISIGYFSNIVFTRIIINKLLKLIQVANVDVVFMVKVLLWVDVNAIGVIESKQKEAKCLHG